MNVYLYRLNNMYIQNKRRNYFKYFWKMVLSLKNEHFNSNEKKKKKLCLLFVGRIYVQLETLIRVHYLFVERKQLNVHRKSWKSRYTYIHRWMFGCVSVGALLLFHGVTKHAPKIHASMSKHMVHSNWKYTPPKMCWQ